MPCAAGQPSGLTLSMEITRKGVWGVKSKTDKFSVTVVGSHANAVIFQKCANSYKC
jgi:hypothetical protein